MFGGFILICVVCVYLPFIGTANRISDSVTSSHDYYETDDFTSYLDITRCSSSSHCPVGWMCNFDFTINGFCEDCPDYECYKAAFTTNIGTQECKKVCT